MRVLNGDLLTAILGFLDKPQQQQMQGVNHEMHKNVRLLAHKWPLYLNDEDMDAQVKFAKKVVDRQMKITFVHLHVDSLEELEAVNAAFAYRFAMMDVETCPPELHGEVTKSWITLS